MLGLSPLLGSALGASFPLPVEPEYVSLLILEDGTNVANANTLITAAMVTTHATLIGNTAWAALTSAQQESAIYRAMRWYRSLEGVMKGYRSYETQNLPHPRTGINVNGHCYDYNIIPNELKDALIEASLLDSASADALEASFETNVKSIRKSLFEVGSKETEYFNAGGMSSGPGAVSYPKVWGLMNLFLDIGQGVLVEH